MAEHAESNPEATGPDPSHWQSYLRSLWRSAVLATEGRLPFYAWMTFLTLTVLERAAGLKLERRPIEIVEVSPSIVEWKVTAGIGAVGLLIYTGAIKIAVPTLTGDFRLSKGD
jgi:hypothetical protein